jgi:hypothetical protein
MRGGLATLGLAWLALLGCSLMVDTSELDAGCPEGEKFCGRCVSETDPAYGCASGVCAPCDRLPHAFPTCKDGRCVAGSCLLGWGCEQCDASLFTDETNCGACEMRCATNERCVAGLCVVPDE